MSNASQQVMTQRDSVAWLIKAEYALGEASSVLTVKELLDGTATAKYWADRRNYGADLQRKLDVYGLKVERKLGGMLAEMPKAPAGRPPNEIGNDVLPISAPPTLASLGITKRLSSEAQRLARLPDDRFTAILTGELTRKQAMAKDAHIAQNTGVSELLGGAEPGATGSAHLSEDT